MENIEQIKQERDKLQERLNNAAKFFREQKAQIEVLTKENEELKNEKKEITLDSSEEVLKENNELKVKLQNSNDAYEELRKKYQELKELNDGDLKRYNELEDNYEGLQNKYQELEKQKNEAEEKAKMWHDNLRGVEKTTDGELKKAYEERDSWLTKYRELESKFKENDIAKGEAELKASNLQSEYTKKFEEQDKEIKKLNANNDRLQDTITSKDKAYKVLQDTYNEVYEEINELKETNKKNVYAYDDLKDKFDKLNIIYNDLENEKLAWEADYKNLENKFKSIKENSEINKEIEEKLTDTLFKIRELADNILNPMPASEQLEEKITKGEVKVINNNNKVNNFGLHDLGQIYM